MSNRHQLHVKWLSASRTKADKLISTHTFYISSPMWVKLSTGALHVMLACNSTKIGAVKAIFT